VKLNQIYSSIPEKWIKLFLFYSFSFAFILLNAWLVVKKDTLLGVLIPVIFAVIVLCICLVVFKSNKNTINDRISY